jgi:glycosyltransferase involved in cell wall biosynthesis
MLVSETADVQAGSRETATSGPDARAADEEAAAGMRVAIVGPLPPPSGGMANQTLQLARLLTEEGVIAETIQVNAPYSPRWIASVPVIRAAFRLIPYIGRVWRGAGRNDLFHVMANSGWSWHLFATPAIWVARLRGIPVVVNYRGGEAETFLGRSAALVRFSMRRAAALVVPSGFLQQVFSRFGLDARIVPNVVDLDKFHPGPSSPAGMHIVIARNLEPLYDIGTGLRAMALLLRRFPDARMSIAGSGPERERLENLAVELGIGAHVRFTGRLESGEMAELYRSATVCLNTALADNMPNSVLEALASGLPVVSTSVGGVPFLVEDEKTALLVAAGDAVAMADAIARFSLDSTLRQRLVRNGLNHVTAFTWERIGALWLRTYRLVMS